LRAQAAHDTEVAERTLGSDIAKIRPWSASDQPGVPADVAAARPLRQRRATAVRHSRG
jgi:hypothetical protein